MTEVICNDTNIHSQTFDTSVTQATKREALLVGHNLSLMLLIPQLLSRAGFVVDVVSTAKGARRLQPIRQLYTAFDDKELLAIAADLSSQDYDLVVIGDDHALREIVQSDLSNEIKLKLLPVCSVENFKHIGTKIGLSQVFEEMGVCTPAFQVANNTHELQSMLDRTTYPLILKIDFSGGGAGICTYSPKAVSTSPNALASNSDTKSVNYALNNDLLNSNPLNAYTRKALTYPLLVQKFIHGDLLDLSGFFQNGNLVHFSYSRVVDVISNAFGLSSVRRYQQLATVPAQLFDLMRHFGQTLGAHGFVCVSCLHEPGEQADRDKYYFVEADMRPTTWADYARYFGDDPAIAINRYFEHGHTLSYPQPLPTDYPAEQLIPFVYRLNVFEVLTNRYHVWSYCEGFSKIDILRYLAGNSVRRFKQCACQHIKPRISPANWERMRLVWRTLFDLS